MRWNATVRQAAAAGMMMAGIWSMAALAPAQDEVIIEARTGGQNADQYAETEGSWYDSESKAMLSRLTSGIGSRYVQLATGPVDAKAVFKPNVPAAGEWEIQVAWGKSGNAGPVTYHVKAGETAESRELFQSGWGGSMNSNSDTWHSLGVYQLEAGPSVEITVDASTVTENPDTRNSWRVYADALRLVKPGSEAAESSKFDPTMATPRAPATTTAAAPAPETAPAPATSSAPSVSPSGDRIGESPFISGQVGEPGVSSPAAPSAAPYVVANTESDTPFIPSNAAPSTTAASAQAQSSNLTWLTDYRQAVSQGIQDGKPIVLFFHVPGQAQSQQLESNALADPAVGSALGGFVLCKIRLGDNPQLDAHYKANQAPMLYFLNSSGVSVARAVGAISAADLQRAIQQYQ